MLFLFDCPVSDFFLHTEWAFIKETNIFLIIITRNARIGRLGLRRGHMYIKGNAHIGNLPFWRGRLPPTEF